MTVSLQLDYDGSICATKVLDSAILEYSFHLINYTIIQQRMCLSIGTPVHSIGAPQYYYYYD